MENESVAYQTAAYFTCLESCSFMIHFNITLPSTLYPPSDILTSGFRTKTLYEFIFSAMHSTSSTHLILYLFTLIMFGGYRLPYLSHPCRYEVC